MFIATVILARTHKELVRKVQSLHVDQVLDIINNQAAIFLRYTSAIDPFLEAIEKNTFASFMFGAIRFMLTLAVKIIKLFIAIWQKLADIDMYFYHLDVYLCLSELSKAVS